MSLPVLTRARASALLAGGAALCSIASAAPAQAADTLRVGAVPIEGAGEVFYAKEMGLFAKAGLDVDIQMMQSAVALAGAVASNSVDIGWSTVDVLAAIHGRNVPVVIIAPAFEYVSPATTRITGLVVPVNSPVRQAKDLAGKIIAVSGLHGLAETAARVWIDRNGGDSSTVKFVELAMAAMPAALEAGRIDAASIVEPFLSVAAKNGRVLEYGLDGISKRFLISAWYATPQWARDHPDLVKRFVGVMHDTAVWANKNPSLSGEILVKYTKADPAVIATMARGRYGEQLTAASMQPFIDVTAKYNGLSSFPAQELIYEAPR